MDKSQTTNHLRQQPNQTGSGRFVNIALQRTVTGTVVSRRKVAFFNGAVLLTSLLQTAPFAAAEVILNPIHFGPHLVYGLKEHAFYGSTVSGTQFVNYALQRCFEISALPTPEAPPLDNRINRDAGDEQNKGNNDWVHGLGFNVYIGVISLMAGLLIGGPLEKLRRKVWTRFVSWVRKS